MRRFSAFTGRFATFTFCGNLESEQPLWYDRGEPSTLSFPLTRNKKYRVLDKSSSGFTIKDDSGELKQFPWGSNYFILSN